jgi:hypothetical protein
LSLKVMPESLLLNDNHTAILLLFFGYFKMT